MRVIFSLLHLLVGLFAIALVTGLTVWALPAYERSIEIVGGAAMALLIGRHIWRLIRPKKIEKGTSE